MISLISQFYERLRALCILRLRDSLNQETNLFDRQLRNRAWRRTCGTENITSTAICLIAIERAKVDAREIQLDVDQSLLAIMNAIRQSRYWGSLGLAIWANATCDRLSLQRLLETVGFSRGDLNVLAPVLTTMELAWLVSGLAHELQRGSSTARGALDSCLGELVSRYYRDSQLFCHATGTAPFRHRLRRWIANFADQIYSVQALTVSSLTTGCSGLLDIAAACAGRLVQVQGPMGQWWWHYDPRDGRIAQAYPVYSVHQYGMAPMALLTMIAAHGPAHIDSLLRSLRWIEENELEGGLIDDVFGTIWRDIHRAESLAVRTIRRGRVVLGGRSDSGPSRRTRLRVNYETRPYEWGWCLFAGALAAHAATSQHIV
jgi:hypothetical protein